MEVRDSIEEIEGRNLYYDPHFGLHTAKILPGEYYATVRDLMLVTVLGSCVAACIRDRRTGLGGMNHFMLPHGPGSGAANSVVTASARFGAYAMEVLINSLIKMGARRNDLEAKVFGGGAVIEGFVVNNVGERNSEFVLNYLREEKIEVAAQDLMGPHPRKVYYRPNNGKVMVKRLRILHNDTILSRETEYNDRLMHNRIAGDVELFV